MSDGFAGLPYSEQAGIAPSDCNHNLVSYRGIRCLYCEVERLRALLAQAQQERDEALREIGFKKKALRNCREAHLAAEDLAERRRAGLQAIIDYVPEGFISPMDDEDSMNYRAIARAALQSENTEEER